MAKGRILVVDDEVVICKSIQRILSPEGYEVEFSLSGEEALEKLNQESFDIVITDLKMPGMDGIELLTKVKEKDPEIIVIMITGYSTVQTAVQAMKMGALDYIPKPFTPEELVVVVEKALDKKKLIFENIYLHKELEAKYSFENIVGNSQKMQEVFKFIHKVAPADSTVLIYGESGTGKELIARAIHFNSLRKNKPFFPVDCGTLSQDLLESELFGHVKGSFTGAVFTKQGILEVADGGSVFLDEIGDINPVIQGKLLRVIQEQEFLPVGGVQPKKVNLRFIVATNKNLEKLVKEQRFREDLYYRLNVVSMTIPPLRERKDDIPILAYHFLKKFNQEMNKDIKSISVEAMNKLINYEWPGNVRQLENVIERAVVMGESQSIVSEYLPSSILGKGADIDTKIPKDSEELKQMKKYLRESAVENVEKMFVLEALNRNDWNVTRTAKEVGMQRTNLQALMRKYNIRVREENE